MRNLISLAFFSLILCLNTKAQSFNSLLASMLQDTLDVYVSQISNIKGMSVGVHIPGQGIWTGVSGNSHNGQQLNRNMKFGIASNSKLFASVILLKLAENGTLSLEDSLHKWLSIANPNINSNITIRQLLNHSSGISDPIFISPWMDTIRTNPNRVFSSKEVLGWVGKPLFPAGTSYGYSNINYIIAALIAQSASGSPISKLIRDSILNPLNLNNTFYDVDDPSIDTIAHRWWNGIDYHDTSRVGLNSAGGCAGSIFSNSSDMVEWYHALMSGKILSKASLNQLTQFIPTTNPNYQYGLGLSREITQGLAYWGHSGSTWGYKSKMIHDTCLNVSVCGLSNSFPSGMDAVTFLIYRAVKNHIPGCCQAISGPDTVCAGSDSVTFSVSPIPNAITYSWSLPSGISGFSNSHIIKVKIGQNASSGDISVTGINNYGSGGSSTFPFVVNPIPRTPVISLKSDTLFSDVASGNQWYNSSGPIAGATHSTFIVPTNDVYYCIVTQSGCTSDTSNFKNVVLTGNIDESYNDNLSLFPNPFISQTTLSIDFNFANASLRIENIFGQTVMEMNNIHSQRVTLQRNNLPSGLFYIRIKADDKPVITKKVIITDGIE